MPTAISSVLTTVVSWVHTIVALVVNPPAPATGRRRGRGEHGQATTEYALVLLAAALVALLVVAWATAGGGAAKIGRLFDRVIDAVTDRV